jgi:hypothetical protein
VSTRYERAVTEAGKDNAELIAGAYYEGWRDMASAVRAALAGTPIPRTSDALRTWITEDVDRLRIPGLVLDVLEGEES